MPDPPRRLTFGANADAYERARPDWPVQAARFERVAAIVDEEPALRSGETMTLPFVVSAFRAVRIP